MEIGGRTNEPGSIETGIEMPVRWKAQNQDKPESQQSHGPGLSLDNQEVHTPVRGVESKVLYLTIATNKCISLGYAYSTSSFRNGESQSDDKRTFGLLEMENCLGLSSGKTSARYSSGIVALLNSLSTSAIVLLGLFA